MGFGPIGGADLPGIRSSPARARVACVTRYVTSSTARLRMYFVLPQPL